MNRTGKYVSRPGSSDPMRWVSGTWTPWVRAGMVVVASMMVGSVFLLIWNVSREVKADGLGGVGVVELMVVSDESSRGGMVDEKRGGGVFVDRIALARYDLGAGEVGRTISKPAVIPDTVEVRMARRELTLDSVLRAKDAALAAQERVGVRDWREVGNAEAVSAADVAGPAPKTVTVPASKTATVIDAGTPMYNGRPLRKVKTMKMKVTAYSPDEQSCGIWADGITASGYSVWTNGMKLVAADTKLLKFGTIITVPGYHDNRPVPVLDRGGKIKGNRLDVLYPSHEMAMEWGVKELEVDVWEYADQTAE